MNINIFSPKVTQPLALRVSERRQRTTQHIDRSCFKKIYKPKAAKVQTVVNNDTDESNCLENQQRSCRMIFELAAHKVFAQLPLNSKQAKTVQSLRVKRLKKLLNHQAAMDIVFSQTSLQSRNLMLTVGNSRRKQSYAGKSLIALSRVRDNSGRFAGDFFSKKSGSTTDHGADSLSITIASANENRHQEARNRNPVFDFSAAFFSELNSATGSCQEFDFSHDFSFKHYSAPVRNSSQELVKADVVPDISDHKIRSNNDIYGFSLNRFNHDEFDDHYRHLQEKSPHENTTSAANCVIREAFEENDQLNIDDFIDYL